MSTKPIYQSLNPEDSHEDSFAPLIERFTTYLKARSHKNTTLSLYLASARHFLCWLTQRPFDSREIDPKPSWVQRYVYQFPKPGWVQSLRTGGSAHSLSRFCCHCSPRYGILQP